MPAANGQHELRSFHHNRWVAAGAIEYARRRIVFARASKYPPVIPMKLPDVYSEWRIVAGLALIVLGTANWVIGLDRTQEYSRILARTPKVSADQAYRSFDELDPRTDSAVLAPFSSEQRRVSYATARMDFYHATYLTGQALVLAGVVVTLVGFILLIQRDSRRAHQRLHGGMGANAPPAR
jgi:hypothetical protein